MNSRTLDDPEFLKRRRRGRLQLLLVAAVFLGPLALAFAMYYGGLWQPAGRVEHGRLILPPLPLPEAVARGEAGGPAFVGHWTLLLVAPGECPPPCRDALHASRQTRRALGRDMDRVHRLWLVTGGTLDRAWLEREHPELITLDAATPAGSELLQMIGEVRPGELLLIDPHGNLMMRFAPGLGMRDLHSDLKRLLKVSRIG
ncbi:MAG: cytochrome oxidase assembly protein [Gammaproteobacteria bacterium]|nr:MAG: cytochrome oxidase assembly protein [Gammaproteobacteria bacterium]